MDFASRFAAMPPTLGYDPTDPTYIPGSNGTLAQALANLATMFPQGQPPLINGPMPPNQMQAQSPPAIGQTPGAPSQTLAASQQPSIPIQSPQGAPQGMVTAPNSGLTGFAPPSGPVLGMGGNGGGQFYGLGSQSPSPGSGESPMASGPLLGKQVSPQQIYSQLNAPRIQQFQQQLAQMLKQIPTLRFS